MAANFDAFELSYELTMTSGAKMTHYRNREGNDHTIHQER